MHMFDLIHLKMFLWSGISFFDLKPFFFDKIIEFDKVLF